MPVALRTSQTCLDILSGRANMALAGRALGMSRRSLARRPVTRGYATAQKKPPASPAQPKAQAAKPKPAKRTSSSSMIGQMRKEQKEAQQQAAQEKQSDDVDQDALAHNEYMNRVSKEAPALDLWTQAEMDVLDLTIPSRKHRGLRWIWDNRQEVSKSAMAVMQITNSGAWPPLYSEPEYPYRDGKTAPPAPAPAEFKLYKPSHISQALKYHAAAPGAWGAGIPGLSLSLYKQMCQAIADNDKQTINRVTASQQREVTLKSLSNRPSEVVYRWKFVEENSPTRIVSLRGGPAYTAKIDAGLNRTIIQALVRFDTIQSFEAFNKRTRQTVSEPVSKRVVEYYVVERKGWTTLPWVIRQRVYDTSSVSEPTEKKVESGVRYRWVPIEACTGMIAEWEWELRRIDYRGLKKRITDIRRWQEGLDPLSSSGEDSAGNLGEEGGDSDQTEGTKRGSSTNHYAKPSSIPINKNSNAFAGPSGRGDDSEEEADAEEEAEEQMKDPDSENEHPVILPTALRGTRSSLADKRSKTLPISLSSRRLESLDAARSAGTSLRRPSTTRSHHSTQSMKPQQPVTLHTLLPTLPPIHMAFFAYLDKQLEKIENFYADREKEAQARNKALNMQLKELKDHRRLYYVRFYSGFSQKCWLTSRQLQEAHPNSHLSWSDSIKTNLRAIPGTISTSVAAHNPVPSANTLRDRSSRIAKQASSKLNWRESQITIDGFPSNGKGKDVSDHEDKSNGHVHQASQQHELDPDDYLHAKKKLKRAVLEHYRKALKKYEKVTKVPAQQAYMKEKVEASAFASGESINAMRKETEDAFAARFEHGNKKRAMNRLRAESQHKSHHFSSFRSGIALGIAVPAIVSGIYHALQPDRIAEPYQGLLLIYGAFAIPVVFALLVGINILVWSDARINYVFIFELDVRTKLDHREYFEVPSILLLALAYAFWLSFAGIGSPTLWPLVWLGVVFGVMFNPLPVMFRSSRWWLIRSVGELLISGAHRVEPTSGMELTLCGEQDYLMDWSFFKPHARYPLLRSDLIYTNEIPFYYFALVSNLLIRFIWVLYIPLSGPGLPLRTFIGGLLEMLRRWQWNFYRLENEHTGNMDQYRISREVPLPYTVDVDADAGEDRDEDALSQRSWLPVRRRKSSREPGTNLRSMTIAVDSGEAEVVPGQP
ncbi:hypothetical protein HWV62_23478 [Athelia sp. TMB]|nr:hypothetical protein HWV62_23478 [Athelia sp. TMB]